MAFHYIQMLLHTITDEVKLSAAADNLNTNVSLSLKVFLGRSSVAS